ncbi:unnamed protein product [Rotaria magnacalcarata]|uniref:RIB43A-like with coiled-coils protein 2 n=3 Tax=Rotaria magnacalcarata TaxID=392030 RepID=A0A815Y4N2_9BILA|nr:unnamed protein product [Rotaria magnacalcarata]CAF1684775.1 unnamed protein product [Rotaria magnacalcarata]CAF2043199.1 unnamed protein product [Rotaria magnacalcarata]CAF2050035.1 unnamed protein product [Rotaria magnacalcarata]CAF2206814.1 unnamed protein product [Rotaria magnacalcarata]
MYKLDLPIDIKEKAAIERRRRAEKERQGRIFNAKQRQIGVDKEALGQQVQDRNWMQDLEEKRAAAFAKDSIRNDTIAQLLERRQQFDERENIRALNEFRALHQQPDAQREWDLNDPDYLKKDMPARVSDDDPRCGLASLQKFQGEDLNARARAKFQQEQLREWSLKQQENQRRAQQQQQSADQLFFAKQIELDQRAVELQQAEEQCRRDINKSTRDYNDALFRENQERRALKKRQEEYDNFAEMANLVSGDLLSENPDQAISQFGPHRVVPDRWKGMNAEQLRRIREEQQKQLEEKKRRDEEEQQRQNEWDQRRIAEAKAGMIAERQIERERRAQELNLYNDNQRLSNEQRNLKAYLDRVVYTNQPTAAYFTQFNSSSR